MKEKFNKMVEEHNKINDLVNLDICVNEKDEVEKIEILYKEKPKGISVYKVEGNKVMNSDQCEDLCRYLITKFFTVDVKTGKFKINVGETELKGRNLHLNVVKKRKQVKYIYNDQCVWVMRLVKRDGKYYLSQKAIIKTIEVLNRYFKKEFELNSYEFIEIKDLLAAVDEYML